VPAPETDSPPIPPTPTDPPLVRCHTCGYDIPHQIGTKCPECATVWDEACDLRQRVRQSVEEEFGHKLKVAAVIWFAILLTYAFGAFFASRASAPGTFLIVLLGIGFGVVTSFGLGVWTCKLGPSHQFKLHAHAWVENLWWPHAPWLLIAPLTIIGSAIALATRLINPETSEGVMIAVISIEFLAWVLLSLAAGVIWIDKYAQSRNAYAIHNANTIITTHVLFAIAIWLGSGVIGFFGGLLGSLFIIFIGGGNSTMDF